MSACQAFPKKKLRRQFLAKTGFFGAGTAKINVTTDIKYPVHMNTVLSLRLKHEQVASWMNIFDLNKEK